MSTSTLQEYVGGSREPQRDRASRPCYGEVGQPGKIFPEMRTAQQGHGLPQSRANPGWDELAGDSGTRDATGASGKAAPGPLTLWFFASLSGWAFAISLI